LVAVTALSGYLQITLGGLVRVSGSGLGCPDWPAGYGKPYPPLTFHAIVEYSHRANGALFGLLVILTVLAGFWLYRGRRTPVTWLTVATLATVVAEGLLGWQVVANLLAPVLVLVHLAIALLILGLMVATYILAGSAPATVADRGFGRLAGGAAALTFLLVLTGSSVVATRADEVCKSWPLCGNGFGLDFGGPAAFDMLHRLTAGVVGLFLVYVLVAGLRRHRRLAGGHRARLHGRRLARAPTPAGDAGRHRRRQPGRRWRPRHQLLVRPGHRLHDVAHQAAPDPRRPDPALARAGARHRLQRAGL